MADEFLVDGGSFDGSVEILDERRKMEAVAANDDDRANYSGYVADRVANGWTASDVAEYKKAVSALMQSGSDDDKLAARQFWSLKATERAYSSAAGINGRVRYSIAQAKDEQRTAA